VRARGSRVGEARLSRLSRQEGALCGRIFSRRQYRNRIIHDDISPT
jgi:hypothetical protein